MDVVVLLLPAALLVKELLVGQARRVAWPIAAVRRAGRGIVPAPWWPALPCMPRHKRASINSRFPCMGVKERMPCLNSQVTG